MQGQLLNNAPPVPSAFIGAPVSPQVPPQGRELVPTLDRDYCDHTRHLLTCRASRMALASDFCPGEIPKSLGLLTRRLPDLTTRTLQVLAMACPISTSHPPCPLGHRCFRRLSYSPTSRACAPECRDSKISPESLIPSRVIRTPSVVALVRPFRAAPWQDWLPAFIIGQGDSGRPETRFRVAQSRLWKAPDWVESGVVSPGSARCNRTSPITGIRLRAMRLVTVGSGHEKDVYRRSGCVGAHPCLPKNLAAV